MRQIYVVLMSSMFAALLATGIVVTQDDVFAQGKGKAQTVCPVMGDPINRNIFVDYNGKRIYFCCNMCPAEFRKDPAKYMRKLNDAGVVPEKSPDTGAGGPHKGHKH